MKYYFKKALIPWVYLVFMTVLSLSVHAIENVILKYVLVSATLLLYLFIVGSLSYKDGEKALKIRIKNDIERRTIIETGEDRHLDLVEEYKFYKGFLMGIVVSLPLFVLLILHTILIPSSNGVTTVFGTITNVIYSMIFNFFRSSGASLTVYTTYWTLLYVPAIMLAMGIPYILGAKSVEKQQEQIKKIHGQIYGE